jgi:D-lactate dehydrogenase
MKIHYFSKDGSEEAYIQDKLAEHTVTFHHGGLSDFPELTDSSADALCVFVDSPVGEKEFERFPNLKLVATRSTGFDHIDLEAAKARGITVASVPAYGENTVAEFTFALILTLSRKIIRANEKARALTFSPEGLRGFDLAGKTLGVIGTGRIGTRVIKAAKGFDMQVVAFDAFPNADLSAKLNFSYLPLQEVLAQADILTLHVPYNKDTHHLLNTENMSRIKKGAYLINTARGGVVETEALFRMLENGTIAGAGLDVLEGERELESGSPFAELNKKLIAHPHVIATPHTAFNTHEGVKRILDTTVENILAFASGTPTNVIS